MIIRAEQFAALSDAVAKRFEDRVVVHLQKCFPKECGLWGEPAVRDLIQFGIGRASAYKITTERDICKYIDVMVVFGRDFDRDPRFPWVPVILNDRALYEPTRRLETLYEEGRKQHGRLG
jgi:hypothetical protein